MLNKQLKEIAVELAKQPGTTLTSLAAKLKISRATLYLYFQRDKDLLDKVTEALEMADDLVEISLFRSAIGYSHPEEKIFCTPTGTIRRAKTIKHYPPNYKAQAMWLTNRRPDKWRNKIDDADADAEKPIKIEIDEKDL